jgi:hypothetical protein
MKKMVVAALVTVGLLSLRPAQAQQGCVYYTQGYWKNHPGDWPVNSLTLGELSYDKDQLLSILKQRVRGNGLVALAHQLIAAKLNQAAGAVVPDDVKAAIEAADELIGWLRIPPFGDGWLHPSRTSEWIAILDDFNEGNYPCEGGPIPGD